MGGARRGSQDGEGLGTTIIAVLMLAKWFLPARTELGVAYTLHKSPAWISGKKIAMVLM